MKHFTLDAVKRMEMKPLASVPKPFPGEWPTRIAWTYEAHRMPYFAVRGPIRPGLDFKRSYVGKPTISAVNQLVGLLGRFPAHRNVLRIKVWEFDRENVILRQFQNLAGDNVEMPETQVGTLFSAYHPWQNHGYWLEHFRTKNYFKKIGDMRLYANVPKLSKEYVDKYKVWMLKHCDKKLRSKEERLADLAERKLAHRKRIKRPEEPIIAPPAFNFIDEMHQHANPADEFADFLRRVRPRE